MTVSSTSPGSLKRYRPPTGSRNRSGHGPTAKRICVRTARTSPLCSVAAFHLADEFDKLVEIDDSIPFLVDRLEER